MRREFHVRFCEGGGVRFPSATRLVMGFQSGHDARQMRVALQERLQHFGLQLHEEKTRVMEFGRLPALAHQQRGERRLGTFAFLGFTHYAGWTRDGRFIVKRKTQRGQFAYFGLPSNFRALTAFAHHVRRIWFRALYRRSQRRLTWAAFEALLDRFPLPRPRIMHPRVK